MDSKLDYWLGWTLVVLFAAAFGAMVAMGAGCTAEQGALAKTETTAVGSKVEQCVQSALADEIADFVRNRKPLLAPAPQPQTILVPVLPGIGVPSTPHESVPTPRNLNTLDGGAL